MASSTACPEPVFDDSGVSDVASNSTNSTGGDVVPPDCHMVAKEGSQDSGSEVVLCATGERWANVSDVVKGGLFGQEWVIGKE